MLISFLVASNSFPHIACGRSLSLPLYLLPTPAHKSDPGARRTGLQLGNKFIASPTRKSAYIHRVAKPKAVLSSPLICLLHSSLQICRVKRNFQHLSEKYFCSPTNSKLSRLEIRRVLTSRQVGKK